ncbi:MAG: glycoside hydrolase family 88 protein [Puniceicoccales bacterium]|jgi:rhamnogalacturonyl hydrolase YesR|nr:glycoside hydrolase family 88 protein [Puniceicoccales bacterium]
MKSSLLRSPSLIILAALALAPLAFNQDCFAQSASVTSTAASTKLDPKELDIAKIVTDMQRVADWQLANMPAKRQQIDWTFAAYYTGHMALADISPDSQKYLDKVVEAGKKYKWGMSPRGSTKYHADDHAIGQVYIELAQRLHNPKYIEGTQKFFDFLLENPPKNPDDLDFSKKGNIEKWSWCDALFMAPPTMARLSVVTGDQRYLDYMNNRWWHTTDHLYDKEESLYYRDDRFVGKKEANGKKVFWSRGNGWVLAGIARVLQYMPADYPERPRYEKLFKDMAAKLITLQDKDGCWRTSLLDPGSFPAPETSGTGFISYAFTWGVNTGLLDRATYWPSISRAWYGINSHVTADGKLGSCQPIGHDPKKIKESDSENYGAGAYLLFASEMYKAAILAKSQHGTVTIKNPGDELRNWETVEIPSAQLKELTGTTDPAEVLVFDALSARLADTQAFDSNNDGTADTLLYQATIGGKDTKRYTLVRKPAEFKGPEPIKLVHARFVPERMDDYAWESDRIAHRMYGPALIKGEGTLCSGVDIWLKSTSAMIVDKFYKGKDYHKDHGEGLDCYDVGQSRGIGGSVVHGDGKWYPSDNFVTNKTLANGPIRAVFELTYAPWNAGSRKISETKRFTVEGGKDFTKVVSTYSADGDAPLQVGIGAVRVDWKGRKKHATKAYIMDDTADSDTKPAAEGKNWFADWQTNTGKNGTTGVGIYVPGGTSVKAVEGHWIVVGEVKPGVPQTYYLGAGWDKGWYPTKESWTKAVETFAKTEATPLQVSVGK